MSTQQNPSNLSDIFTEYMQKKQDLIQSLYAETTLPQKRTAQGTRRHRRAGEDNDSKGGAGDRVDFAAEANLSGNDKEVLWVHQRILQYPVSDSKLNESVG